MTRKKKSNVHIACYDDGHIVPRMMQWLVDGLGWSIGNHLSTDDGVINYYAPYTMYGRYGASNGKSMAWFTHIESDNPAKRNIWDRATDNVDLSLVTSPVYLNDVTNPYVIVPGVDQNHFVPSAKKRKPTGVVGLVGVPQPRKGLELAQAIFSIEGVTEVRAVGGKWDGIESKTIAYQDMPEFYRGIDLFVCTSTEEGIPAPPLEALACGVPVVIPTGVGALDLLPDELGTYRYPKGDVKKMREQISLHFMQTPNHKSSDLRSYVAPYTIESWCQSHKAAAEVLNA